MLDWMDYAECRNLSREKIARVMLNSNPVKKDILDSKETCAKCPVQKTCLVQAIKNQEGVEGRCGTFIWGGMNLKERMAFYKLKRTEGTWLEYVQEAKRELENVENAN